MYDDLLWMYEGFCGCMMIYCGCMMIYCGCMMVFVDL